MPHHHHHQPHSLKPPPPSSGADLGSTKSTTTTTTAVESILDLPMELQVNFLTYLRAYDLASVHQTCQYYRNPRLVHACVEHCATQVYPAKLTAGFAEQPILGVQQQADNNAAVTTKNAARSAAATTTSATNTTPQQQQRQQVLYTYEHLRNMELLVVARVLAQPEPATGYIVSKSWCKQALRWLEMRHEQRTTQQQLANTTKKKKKLSKKKQRLRQRKLSDVSPPWPNVNSDLLCEHNCLQVSSNSKSTRARRKVLDKQAWKILKKLYPDSTMLQHECLACAAEARIERKTAADQQEQLRLQRKQPLSDPVVRRFYTRTKGVPQQALRGAAASQEQDQDEDGDSKLPATAVSSSSSLCPLQPGRYYVLPRAWCYGWRRYIRTGEGGSSNNNGSSSNGSSSYPPPDAACLLCDAHRMVLMPPHLEAYLYGEQDQLLASSNDPSSSAGAAAAAEPGVASPPAAVSASTPSRRRLVPGQAPDNASVQALLAAGLSPVEVRRQISAMHSMEEQQQLPPPPPPPPVVIQHPAQHQQQQQHQSVSSSMTKNERLDRENHAVVEIVTQAEFQALAGLWDSGNQANLCFGVSFTVSPGGHVDVDMPVCRACDATGRQHLVCCVRNRTIKKRNTAAATDSNVSVKQQQQQQGTSNNGSSGNGNSNSGTASGGASKPRMPMEYY